MKPNNLKQQNCESKSTDCVVWDGPDLTFDGCLNIKCGDTVTALVYALAKKLCEVNAVLEIKEEYNIVGLDLGIEITNFNELMRALISRIVFLSNQ